MPSSRKALVTAVFSDLAIAAAKLAVFSSAVCPPCSQRAFIPWSTPAMDRCLYSGCISASILQMRLILLDMAKSSTFWTLLVALFIFLVGGGISIANGIRYILHPVPISHILWNCLTLGVAALFEGYSLIVGLEEFKQAEGVPASLRAIHAIDRGKRIVDPDESAPMTTLVNAEKWWRKSCAASAPCQI